MDLPSLGVGITYIEGIEPLLAAEAGIVDVLEIEPQTIWLRDSRGRYRVDERAFDAVRRFPCAKLLHGVGFPVGGTCPPDPAQIPLLRRMLADLRSPWISEHLGFNFVRSPNRSFHTGFLLPPRQTARGVAAAVNSIKAMAQALPVPFAVETGVSYLQPWPDEMPDGEFVAAVVEAADCGLLVDLHNLWTNQENGRQNVREFLRCLPLERVWEVHLAGGSEQEGYWLDAHSGEVPAPLFELAAEVIPQFTNLRAITFEISASYLPAVGLDVIRSQLERIRAIWESRRTAIPRSLRRSRSSASVGSDEQVATPEEWEHSLGSLVVGLGASGSLASELSRDPGIQITRDLVNEFRASMVAGTLKLTCRLLMLSLGKARFRELLMEFWTRATPHLFATAEAAAFAEFVTRQELTVPHLGAVLQFELSVLQTLTNETASVVTFPCDPMQILGPLGEGRLPSIVAGGDFEIEVSPTGVPSI